MIPGVLDLTVHRGAAMDALFTFSDDVGFTAARLVALASNGRTVVRNLVGSELVVDPVGRTVDVVLDGLATEELSDGEAKTYQLDLLVDGRPQRMVRGKLVIVDGARSTFA